MTCAYFCTRCDNEITLEDNHCTNCGVNQILCYKADSEKEVDCRTFEPKSEYQQYKKCGKSCRFCGGQDLFQYDVWDVKTNSLTRTRHLLNSTKRDAVFNKILQHEATNQ